MPTPVISILALASFVVHPESGDKVYLVGSSIWESPSMRVMLTFVILLKVTMGITTMVTMVVFLTMVIPCIPATGERPLLSEYWMGILLKFVNKLICAFYFAGVFFAITLIMTTVITLLEAVITRMYRTARPLPAILKMPTRSNLLL